MNTTANIYDAESDSLVPVDLTTLPESQLLNLRDEAGAAGDTELVYLIGEVTGQRQYWSAEQFFSDYFPIEDAATLQAFADQLAGRSPSFQRLGKVEPNTQEWLDAWAETTSQTRQLSDSHPTYALIDDVQAWLGEALSDDDWA
jgi:hypothetical protein